MDNGPFSFYCHYTIPHEPWHPLPRTRVCVCVHWDEDQLTMPNQQMWACVCELRGISTRLYAESDVCVCNLCIQCRRPPIPVSPIKQLMAREGGALTHVPL